MLAVEKDDVVVEGAPTQVGMTFRIFARRRRRGRVASNSLLALTFFS